MGRGGGVTGTDVGRPVGVMVLGYRESGRSFRRNVVPNEGIGPASSILVCDFAASEAKSLRIALPNLYSPPLRCLCLAGVGVRE